MAKFHLQDVYNVTGIGIVIVGKVLDGTLKPGMTAQVGGLTISAVKLEIRWKTPSEARPGDNVGVYLRISGPISSVPEEKRGFFQSIFGAKPSYKDELLKFRQTDIEFN
jgi:translation elongation factor EF-Tu-like GTPase